MEQNKCDHPNCNDTPLYYGHQHCYVVCEEHVAWGEAIEAKQQEILELDIAIEENNRFFSTREPYLTVPEEE